MGDSAASVPPRVEEIRRRLAQINDPLWPGLTESDWAEDVRFLLEQYDAAVKILAEAEKVVPGLITTAGRFAVSYKGFAHQVGWEDVEIALRSVLDDDEAVDAAMCLKNLEWAVVRDD